MRSFLFFLLLATFCFSATATADVIHLKDGQMIQAEILKADQKRIIVDLGFDILQIPRNVIVQIEKPSPETKKEPSLPEKHGLYSSSNLNETTIKENVLRFGEAVVKVSTPSGTGSGFFIDKSGYVVTNYHVIAGEREISITVFKQNEKILEKIKHSYVKIIAFNPFIDLALLKIEDDPKNPSSKPLEFPIAYLGNFDEMGEGTRVFCIGNPLGMERSVSDGIVSAKMRQFEGRVYIQTTAAINPGNSGGPMFNSKGEVVGVVNMKIMFGDNLGFAIPVSYLKDFLKHREAFLFDKSNPNSGFIYYTPPPKKNKSKESSSQSN